MNLTKSRTESRSETLVNARRKARPLILDFHPSLSVVCGILKDLIYPVLAGTTITKEIFPLAPFVSFRRPKIIKDNLVRAKVPKLVESSGSEWYATMRQFQVPKISRLVSGFDIPFRTRIFNILILLIINLIVIKMELLIFLVVRIVNHFIWVVPLTLFVDDSITMHKSCLNRYGRGQREMPGEHLYAHCFSEGDARGSCKHY